MSIKFNKYHVTDGKVKVRVFYRVNNRIDGRKCITLYAKDYGRGLGRIFIDEYKNDTDMREDYFDNGKVVLFEDHPLYDQALKRAQQG